MSEPLKRANRLRLQDPLDEKPGVFARVAINSSGRIGMTSNCIKCVIGTRESPIFERKVMSTASSNSEKTCRSQMASRQVQPEPNPQPQVLAQTDAKHQPDPQYQIETVPVPRTRTRVGQTLGSPSFHSIDVPSVRNGLSCSIPRQVLRSPSGPPPPIPDSKTSLCCQCPAPPNYGSNCNVSVKDVMSLSDSDSSSCDSLDLPAMFPLRGTENRRRAAGTLQREMNSLFAQRMDEIRSKSPLFFAGKVKFVAGSQFPSVPVG